MLSLLAILPIVYFISIEDSVSISEDLPLQTQAVEDDGFVSFLQFSGVVEYWVHDKDGNLKQYDKTHNMVVNSGENCALKLLMAATGGDASGNTVCTGTIDAGFRYIGLEESAVAVAATDVDLNDPADSAGLSTPLLSSASWTNSTGTGAASRAIVVLTAQFTNSGASETITGAALLNATAEATRGMYAHTLFSSSAIVDTTDTLTVTWTVTTGNGTVSTP